MIKLTIPGKPMGKQRPKFVRTGQFVRTYTPIKTVNYEDCVRGIFKVNYPSHDPINGPVIIEIRSYHFIPKATSKKKRIDMVAHFTLPTVKPDLDNVIKIVCDALNGLAYIDDNRIVRIDARKFYSDQPRVEVKISEWPLSTKKGGSK